MAVFIFMLIDYCRAPVQVDLREKGMIPRVQRALRTNICTLNLKTPKL